jgi:hypothetical protein
MRTDSGSWRRAGALGAFLACALGTTACGGGAADAAETPTAGTAASSSGAACSTPGATSTRQLLDGFDWRLEPVAGEELGYRYYSRLAADRGTMGDGFHPHDVVVADGTARLTATQGSRGTSWSGLWFSLSGTAREAGLLLDPRAALPGRVTSALQVSPAAWTVRVKGRSAALRALFPPAPGCTAGTTQGQGTMGVE